MRRAVSCLIAAALCSAPGAGYAGVKPRPAKQREAWLGVGRVEALTSRAWLTGSIEESGRYRLGNSETLDLLARYVNPAIERPAEWRSFWDGRYGVSRWGAAGALTWSAFDSTEPALSAGPVDSEQIERGRGPASNREAFYGSGLFSSPFLGEASEPTANWQLAFRPMNAARVAGVELMPTWALDPAAAPEPELMAITRVKVCPRWQRTRPVTLIRYGAEYDRFALLECDGSVAGEALDRLSVIARPPGATRPELPLPLEPAPGDGDEADEWLPEIKLVHPRLLWVVQNVAQAFPGRAIYVISGYRRDSHGSFHRKGRALDLFVTGISNVDLFAYCRKLKDVGCGFYPNNSFVHIDVRPYGTGHPLWIDVSEPGKPSEYVDAWPGAALGGALDWAAEG